MLKLSDDETALLEDVRDRPRGVLLEMIRRKTAPIAIITQELDPILTLGAIIGGKLYERRPAVITVSPEDF